MSLHSRCGYQHCALCTIVRCFDSHNIIDQRHSLIQKKSVTSPLHCISDWTRMINGIAQYKAEELLPYDFKAWLDPHVNPQHKNLLINNIHVFRFTMNGLITKKYVQDNFSEWRGRSNTNGVNFEPFLMLTTFTEGIPGNLIPKKKGV